MNMFKFLTQLRLEPSFPSFFYFSVRWHIWRRADEKVFCVWLLWFSVTVFIHVLFMLTCSGLKSGGKSVEWSESQFSCVCVFLCSWNTWGCLLLSFRPWQGGGHLYWSVSGLRFGLRVVLGLFCFHRPSFSTSQAVVLNQAKIIIKETGLLCLLWLDRQQQYSPCQMRSHLGNSFFRFRRRFRSEHVRSTMFTAHISLVL